MLHAKLALYAITHRLSDALPDQVEAALMGGATAIQLRLKGATSRELHTVAQRLLPVCRRHEALFVVNDRLDIALAVGADGVHLGPDDLPIEAARRIAPPGFVIGGSAGTIEAAREMVAQGADYLGVGAVFNAHPSKANASQPRGVEVIRRLHAEVDVPLVAIGGITAENARSCVLAGAVGVAAIRAVFTSDGDRDEIMQSARRLRRSLRDMADDVVVV
ncbi:MAG: thiamine phosphate synthase [Myxococcota bacterium]